MLKRSHWQDINMSSPIYQAKALMCYLLEALVVQHPPPASVAQRHLWWPQPAWHPCQSQPSSCPSSSSLHVRTNQLNAGRKSQNLSPTQILLQVGHQPMQDKGVCAFRYPLQQSQDGPTFGLSSQRRIVGWWGRSMDLRIQAAILFICRQHAIQYIPKD